MILKANDTQLYLLIMTTLSEYLEFNMKNYGSNLFENLCSLIFCQIFLCIFNKSSMRICDLLHETCFKLWVFTKKERKKGELLFNCHRELLDEEKVVGQEKKYEVEEKGS